jgi:DNA-binding NtrC family response regulator
LSPSPARILVVDDEISVRDALTLLLESWGYSVQVAGSGAGVGPILERGAVDLILTDLVMPDMDGLAILKKVRADTPDLPVLLLSGQGSINEAVEAIREGAYDYIVKPCEPQRLKLTLQRALEQAQTRREVNVLRRRVREASPGGDFIGQSRAMRDVFSLIQKVAPAKASVVITGESGTGKEMVARAIHNLSPRRDKPFIAINCSAIPPTLMESEIFGYERGAFTGADQRRLGCFELADGGTLFLDEVGEIQPELQAKFLRVLEEERLRRLGGKTEIAVDVRVLAATNRDLKDRIRSNQFREDLYFRLNVFNIQLPPLHDRPEDVSALVDLFVRRFSREAGKKIRGVTASALRRLADYRWPGNIRELRNCMERAVLLCDGEMISEAHLPNDVLERDGEAAIRLPLGLKLREVSRSYIEATLVRCGGNKARTATALGISEKTLYNKLHRYAADDLRKDAGLPAEEEEEDDDQATVAARG